MDQFRSKVSTSSSTSSSSASSSSSSSYSSWGSCNSLNEQDNQLTPLVQTTANENPQKQQSKSSEIGPGVTDLDKDENTWRDVFIRRFAVVMGPEARKVLGNIIINIENVKSSFERKPSEVTQGSGLTTKVLPAMQILWDSTRTGSRDGKVVLFMTYPGFGDDMIRFITNYYEETFDNVPLFTFELYDVLLLCYMKAELTTIKKNNNESKAQLEKNKFAHFFGASASKSLKADLNPSGTTKAIRMFRLLLCTLSTEARCHIYHLLEFIYIVSVTPTFAWELDVVHGNKIGLIKRLLKVLINCENPFEFDECLAIRIIDFMSTNYKEIMSTKPEEESLAKVAGVLILLRRQNEQSETAKAEGGGVEGAASALPTMQNENPCLEEGVIEWTYCYRISRHDYEKQSYAKFKALLDLLRSYTENTAGLNLKMRVRMIEQLKANYPHVFRQGYSDEELNQLKESLKKEKRSKKKSALATLKLPFLKKK